MIATTPLPPLELLLSLVELIEAARSYLDYPVAEPMPDTDYYHRRARLMNAVELLEGRK